MHIAFMQQEARAFEQMGFAEANIEDAAQAKGNLNDPHMFAGEDGDEKGEHHEDGDDEYDFSTSDGSSTLGDIRIAYTDDEDDDEAEKKKKSKRRAKRNLGK